MCYKHLLHHPHSRWFFVSCDSIFRNTKNSVTLNWLKPIIIRSTRLTGYRLCVYASGSVITVVLNCFTLIIISRLHFGQYSGKFSSTVLSQILILVLLLQLGHNSHSFFFILCFSSDNRISMDNYIYNSRSFHRLVETITHAPTMSTVKTM